MQVREHWSFSSSPWLYRLENWNSETAQGHVTHQSPVMAFITLVSPSKASWTSSLVHLLKARFHKACTTLLKKHIGQRSSSTFSDSWVKQTIYNQLLWITGLANVTQIWPENNWKESNVSHRLQIPVSTLHWFCRLSRAKTTESSHGDNTLRGLWSHKLNSSLCSDFFLI